jgi:short subunit dehydrogenase-like uncharacterized protein
LSREYEIILMGATSFVGKIIAERLLASNEISRIAFAARSEAKLMQLEKQLLAFQPKKKFDLLIADSLNYQDMQRIANLTQVVMSTVGPYDLYGELLIKACTQSGTHYCDLTGEPQFIARMINTYSKAAQVSGACIVHCAGFDSIPSDLGTYFLQKTAFKKYGQSCSKVGMRVLSAKGGLSGGTIASMINLIKRGTEDPEIAKILLNNKVLTKSKASLNDTITQALYDEISNSWIAPFLMAPINSKIVYRSAELLPQLYPADFTYNEAIQFGSGIKAQAKAKLISAIMGLFEASLRVTSVRKLLERFVLPKPGTGPSEKTRKSGNYKIAFYGKTSGGQSLITEFSDNEDPGYNSTASIMSQVGISLFKDEKRTKEGGFWTPASLLGESLIERLTQNTTVSIKISEPPSPKQLN